MGDVEYTGPQVKPSRRLSVYPKWGTLLVCATLFGCNSQPAWVRRADGIWGGPDKSELTFSPLPTTLSRSDLVERLEQIHRVHSGSVLMFTASEGVCIWPRSKKTLVYGFNPTIWLVGEFATKDWRSAVASHPLRQVSSFAKVSGIPSPVSIMRSTLRLDDGLAIELPSEWHWLDESIGQAPDLKPETLISHSGASHLHIREFRKSDVDKPTFKYGYTGFSKKLLVNGEETIDFPDKMQGFSYPRKDEWVAIYYYRNSTLVDAKLIRNLLEYIGPLIRSK